MSVNMICKKEVLRYSFVGYKQFKIIEADPMFQNLTEDLTYSDFLSYGMMLKEIKVSSTSREVSRDKNRPEELSRIAEVDIIDKTYLRTKLVHINSANDFNSIYSIVNKYFPNRGLHINYIATTTIGTNVRFEWERKRVPDSSGNKVIKMILIKINGRYPCELTWEEGQEIFTIAADFIVPRFCTLKTTKEDHLFCNGHS